MDIINAFRNNNFALGDEDETRACFLDISRVNHSCVPNAQGNFNLAINMLTVHAVREIASDEEITISYLDDQLASRRVRQARLQESHNFLCACAICTSGSVALESEHRRIKLQRQLRAYAEAEEGPDAVAAEVAMMKTLIEAYKVEGLAGRELATM